MEKDLKEYEVSFLLKTKEDLKAVETVLAQFGAEIFYTAPVSEMKLAYEIKKHNLAHFGYVHFKALPENADKITQALKLNSAVLRSLLVTSPVKKEEKPRRDRERRQSSQNEMRAIPNPTKEQEPVAATPAPSRGVLTNEALEEKLEEILK